MSSPLTVVGARGRNLRVARLHLPRHRLVVLTGVSGSGKSTLALDTLHAEAQLRYLEVASPGARRFLERLDRPEVEAVGGLPASVAVGQVGVVRSPRSTVGTLSGTWDLLKVVFARASGGEPRDFSFNTAGACPGCRGLGVRDRVDPALLVADPAKTLREGALVPTRADGYVMYSQVTVEALDAVCRAHGFSVDVPWADLDEAQRRVVLYGSDRVAIPLGKHPLESRLRWTGMTARARPEGHYGGLVPVIQEILDRKPNPSARRFAVTRPCEACGGSRFSEAARAVSVGGWSPDRLGALTLARLRGALGDLGPEPAEIFEELSDRLEVLVSLGLGHLPVQRPSATLSSGEVRRVRLAGLAAGGLRGLLVVLDEPSAGLHPRELGRLAAVLRRLVDRGNTAVVVEHDPALVRAADHLVDLGPGAGKAGGRVVWEGPPARLEAAPRESRTRRWLLDAPAPVPARAGGPDRIGVLGASLRNLGGVDALVPVGAISAITGPSGAGKSTLAVEVLAASLTAGRATGCREVVGRVDAVRVVRATPPGKTPRSTPATYTKVWDAVRRLLASTPAARERGLGVGHFSFNSRAGACAECGGTGHLTVGLHLLPDARVVCPACRGGRFASEVLQVTWRGHSAAELLALSVEEALALLADQPAAARPLGALVEVGLGELPLGRPSTSLSGGEAQRVKLAAELARPARGRTLIVLDEPTTGLHPADVRALVRALDRLAACGHAVVVVDNDPDLLAAAAQVVDLDPGPAEVRPLEEPAPAVPPGVISLRGVRTHNLQGLDVDLPLGALTVIAGPSGSGKSSLAFHTLHAEAWRRLARGLSPMARRHVGRSHAPELERAAGLGPSLAVGQAGAAPDPRSTVATASGVHELLRLLWSRAGLPGGLPARAFSANHPLGACPECQGLGSVLRCDPRRLVTHPERPLLAGALAGTKVGRHYGDPEAQWAATLRTAAAALDLDLDPAFRDLDPAARGVALHGTGERVWEVEWAFRRGKREGVHQLEAPWPGLCGLVEAEHALKRASRRGRELEELMAPVPCAGCGGGGLGPEPRAVRVAGTTLPELLALPVFAALAWVDALAPGPAEDALRGPVRRRLAALDTLGLGYLGLDRRASTWSGGEARRIQLAGILAGRLTELTVVLDEPTLGLHPRDAARLLEAIRRLVDAGNTAVVVEHDPAMLAAADHLVELGPGPGVHGGRLLAAGPPAEVLAGSTPLAASLRRPRPTPPRRAAGPLVRVRGAHLHNLRGIDVDLPTGCLVAVTGVSGSGKSSLVFGVLAASAAAGRPMGCDAVEGLGDLEVLALDRGEGSRSPASSPATVLGILEPLRALLASTPEALRLGLKRSAFSYLSREGRCPACKGLGQVREPLGPLGDPWVPCAACGGRRFGPALDGVRWRGRTAAEWLDLTAGQALAEAGEAAMVDLLAPLEALGLSHLRLGQPLTGLSGGELRRLRLAAAGLVDPGARPRLVLLDEPAAGLSVADVRALVQSLHGLVDAGHTVVAVEHDLEIVRAADWVVDLGPEGGDGGGEVLAVGTPEDLAAHPTSWTGAALAATRG